MRIAMVGIRGIPARSGGAERVVQELTRELTACGHDVLVYCRRAYVAGSPPPEFGKQIITANLSGKHLETITHTATALLSVIHRGVDVVHIHSAGPALMSWLPALWDIPIVLTIHAPDWLRAKWSRPARAALRLGLACGMHMAEEVTAVSRGLAEQLSARFNRQVHYIPNGVRPVQVLPPKAIARWGLDRCRYVLTVGRIVPEKRLDLLLEAWADVPDKAGLRLVVVGDAAGSRYGVTCRALAGTDVMFLGQQTGDLLSELYSNAELVVQPSGLEGMSLVLLEAAAYGRCILASDIRANLDIMGDSILYFHSEDKLKLTRQISRLLRSEDLRHALGESAKARVLATYPWCATAERMEQIYRRAVLKSKG